MQKKNAYAFLLRAAIPEVVEPWEIPHDEDLVGSFPTLRGWLGFFDAAVIEPQPFESIEEFLVIRPKGGGGTDFQIIFEYVAQYMQSKLPASIIVLTDGYGPFPQEHLAMGIPVLWLLNNEDVEPPWGKVARIEV